MSSSANRLHATQQALRQSSTRLNLALAASRMGVWEWDVRTDRIYCSPHCREIIGQLDGNLSLQSFAALLHTEDRNRIIYQVREALDHKTTFNAEFRIVRPDGNIRWLFNLATGDYDENGNGICLIGTMQDITDRKLAEEQLRESEGKFRSLAEQSLVGTYILQDDLFRYVNERFAEMFGYQPVEIVGRIAPVDLILSEDKQRAGDIWGGTSFASDSVHTEFRGVKKTRETINLELFGSKALYRGRPAVIGLIVDITEKTKLEQQLRQAQKMEAVGQLTSGIAHDFNNIIAAITGFATLLQQKMNKDDPTRIYADNILISADRAATLIRSLLTFSRVQLCEARPVDINEIILNATKLLYWIIGEDIELRTSFADGRLIVNADPGQIEQILMNLATNAADAMPQGGVFRIETTVVNCNSVQPKIGAGHEHCVLISITDTGVGMDEKTREKIFEPFFTTKSLGRGTGLGLSMVYSIIAQHGGSIHCNSKPEAGTNFKIYLPLLKKQKHNSETGSEISLPAKEGLFGSETILLAEDDQTVRAYVKAALESSGYAVIEATGGKEAIELFLQHKKLIRMIVADVIMPGMSGAELEKSVREIAPFTPVLFMSGYPADIVHRKGLLAGEANIIFKPFPPTVLLKKMREMLDQVLITDRTNEVSDQSAS